MLMVHYWTAENIRSDEELQHWIHDMHTEGFPVYTKMHDIPDHFESIEEVTEFMTEVIFTASCQNAALTGRHCSGQMYINLLSSLIVLHVELRIQMKILFFTFFASSML